MSTFRLQYEGAQLKLTNSFLNTRQSSFICGIPFPSTVIYVVDVAVDALKVLLCSGAIIEYEGVDFISL